MFHDDDAGLLPNIVAQPLSETLGCRALFCDVHDDDIFFVGATSRSDLVESEVQCDPPIAEANRSPEADGTVIAGKGADLERLDPL